MVIGAIIRANVRCSRATARRLRLPTDTTLWRLFEKEAEALIRGLPDGAIVLDLGGGRRCVYARAVDPPFRVRLIAIDASPEELALNHDVDDVPSAIRHMARVLKPGARSRCILSHAATRCSASPPGCCRSASWACPAGLEEMCSTDGARHPMV